MPFCKYCGELIADEATYCRKCGAAASSSTAAPPARQDWQAPPQPYSPPYTAKIMGVGAWCATLILTMIPLVGMILLFIWAFGENANSNLQKRNWARANLILAAGTIVLYIIARLLGLTPLSSLSRYY
jgi:uncharacterized membrane protein YvbJ